MTSSRGGQLLPPVLILLPVRRPGQDELPRGGGSAPGPRQEESVRTLAVVGKPLDQHSLGVYSVSSAADVCNG